MLCRPTAANQMKVHLGKRGISVGRVLVFSSLPSPGLQGGLVDVRTILHCDSV